MSRQVDAALPGSEEGESAGQSMCRFYSVLSDYAHPNHSAQHLSASIDETEWMMDWTFDHAWTDNSIHDVLGTAFLALYFGGVAFDRFMTGLTKHPLVLIDRRDA